MYSLLPIYLNGELIQPLLENNQGNWDLTIDGDQANVVKAFFSSGKEFAGSEPTVVSFELRKVNKSRLHQQELIYDFSSILDTGKLSVEITDDRYRVVLNSDLFVPSSLIPELGLFQWHITMSNGDLIYSDVFCISEIVIRNYIFESGDNYIFESGDNYIL